MPLSTHLRDSSPLKRTRYVCLFFIARVPLEDGALRSPPMGFLVEAAFIDGGCVWTALTVGDTSSSVLLLDRQLSAAIWERIGTDGATLSAKICTMGGHA